MKTLLILRGAMGAGKSAFVERNNLQDFTLSSDEIRKLFGNHQFVIDGDGIRKSISNQDESVTWGLISQALERRMQKGDFTVVDATHAKQQSIRKYKKLADRYRYRIFTLQFDIPLDILLEQNKNRSEEKIVPEDVVVLSHQRIQETDFAKALGVVRVTNAEEADKALYETIMPEKYSTWNLNEVEDLEEVIVVGDIHDNYTALSELLKQQGQDSSKYYVFVGDYVDRGTKPIETIELIHELTNDKRSKYIFLTGNHDEGLAQFGFGEDLRKSFKPTYARILKQIISEDVKLNIEGLENTRIIEMEELVLGHPQARDRLNRLRKKARQIWRVMRTIYFFKMGTKTYYVSHGGVHPEILDGTHNLFRDISDNEFITGTGNYSYDIDSIWEKITSDDGGTPMNIQIHGHRNLFDHNIGDYSSINLEQGVDSGGYLGAISINKKNEVKDVSVKSTDFIIDEKTDIEIVSVEDVVRYAEDNRYIRIKKLEGSPDIASYNFTNEAFRARVWNAMTLKARGLFIDRDNNEIVARGFEKFHNVGENSSVDVASLLQNFEFPVRFEAKPNGFLGLVSRYQGEFYFFSKSTNNGIHASMIKEQFYAKFNKLTDTQKTMLIEILETTNATACFEVIDLKKDPHIIEYTEEKQLILLGLIKNQIEFEMVDSEVSLTLSILLGVEHVQTVETVHTKEGLLQRIAHYQSRRSFNQLLQVEPIKSNSKSNVQGLLDEGVVLVDNLGKRVKIKTDTYNQWKMMRGLKDRIGRGRSVGEFELPTTLAMRFHSFLVQEYESKGAEYRRTLLDKNLLEVKREFAEYAKEEGWI